MPEKLTQALVRRAMEDHTPGTQLYDSEVAGLRLVVGKTSCSFKHVGRVNDGTGRYVSIIVGRADEMNLTTARSRSVELRQALSRGEDPRTPTEDAALYLGMSTVTLEQWRCEGAGPAFCKVGRSVRYHVDDLRTFMLERRQRPLA